MSTSSKETFTEDLPDDIKTGLNPTKYDTATTKLKNSFSKVWTNIKTTAVTAFEEIYSKIKKPLNSILSAIESFVNGIIKGLNKAIDAINSISFTIPSWVPNYGGNTIGFNLSKLSTVSLPRLGQGGIVNQPTQLIAGEAGTEAILPLENNTEWMDVLATKIANKLVTNNGNGTTEVTLNFTGSMSQLARILKPELDKESSRVGTKLVIGTI